MKNSEYDWTSFTKRVTINASTKDILESWNTRHGLESWFLSRAEYRDGAGRVRDRHESIGVGDSYIWEWLAATDRVEGKVLYSDGEKALRFTFLGCTVDVSFSVEAGENVVEVRQSNIPLDEDSKVVLHLECTEGWTFYLTNLKSVLEGGIDLRNRNPAINRIINT